jgi:glutathione peroxidase
MDRRTLLAAMAALAVPAQAAAAAQTAHGFTFEAIDGGPLALSWYRGRVLMVVNTASQCGYTGQYDGLQALWRRERERGLTIIGVPSNDFGGQEPGSNAEIQGFCRLNYGVDFPLAARTVVRGPQAHPFYRWARSALGPAGEPGWNFHKILISRWGRALAGFASRVAPDAPELLGAVRAALAS